VVVNVDLPWNPAVLEQRIGRVHRLGQTQPVQVVNFVSQGTIEQGMLSVLAFKKSLFAGVLDGGEKEVFLGGSRLTKFMETVERVTTSIPASDADTTPSEVDGRDGPRLERSAPETASEAAAPENPLAGLLAQGLAVLEELAAAARQRVSNGSSSHASEAPRFVETIRDEQTGRAYLKLPMPDPEVLDRALQAIGTLLDGVRR
jgi:hypothetical protein